jgi:hypothetical protein
VKPLKTIGSFVRQVCIWISQDHADYDGEHIVLSWDHSPLYEATHWMPLPKPPTTEAP